MTHRTALGAVRLLGAALLVGACGSGLGTPPPTRLSGSSPAPTPSGATTPRSPGPVTTGTAAQAFVELTDFPADGAFEVTGAVATADGYVAVGFEGLDGGDYFGPRQGIVWRSSDGRSWQASREEALATVTPVRIASLGSSLFILGLLSTCGEDEGCTQVPEAGYALWRSEAGGSWQRLPPPAGLQIALSVDDLVAGRDRLTAFGSADDERETPMLWTSTDGAGWTETAGLAGIDRVTAFGATPNGSVAFGTVLRRDSDTADLVATLTSDGTSFSAATLPALPNAVIDDVAVGTGGVVGVGRGYSGDDIELRGLALFSADGTSWVEGSADDGSFVDAAVVAAHAVTAGYVAIGFELDDSDFASQAAQAWISGDGQRWRTLAPIGEVSLITASASGTPGLVVFSADQLEDELGVTSTISAWFAPASTLAL